MDAALSSLTSSLSVPTSSSSTSYRPDQNGWLPLPIRYFLAQLLGSHYVLLQIYSNYPTLHLTIKWPPTFSGPRRSAPCSGRSVYSPQHFLCTYKVDLSVWVFVWDESILNASSRQSIPEPVGRQSSPIDT